MLLYHNETAIPAGGSVFPLETVCLSGLTGILRLTVYDGAGRKYLDLPTEGADSVRWCVAGALGTHFVLGRSASGAVVEELAFAVDCQTRLEEGSGRFRELLQHLHDTMFIDWYSGYEKCFRYKGKFYKYYVSWLRDHVHVLKGMKYFDSDLKSGIEIYADSQREDGMIWDKVKDMYPGALQTWRDFEFGPYIRPMEGHPYRRFTRIPVENDVEFLFLEGVYYTWKACGDTAWMSGLLDAAMRAVRYSTSDPVRWSERFRLLKRGYTIDTWDFQSADDIARSGSAMNIRPGVTEFNVFHGDNTGMAVGCEYLAEMLEAAGRGGEAGTYRDLARDLRDRLDALSWNGRFYTHMVPENPEARRDLGNTPTEKQITLSNAYAINRRIDPEKAVAVIRSYQGIRQEMPPSSPGEFYNCFPPFDQGFKAPWQYMNGGVSTICAGELARGAFVHGHARYGVRILDCVLGWARRFGYLHTCLHGNPQPPAQPRVEPVDLSSLANSDFRNDTAEGVIGWLGEGGLNDLCFAPVGPQVFHGIPFRVIDPEANRRRACIGLASEAPYAPHCEIPLGRTARTLYFLHTTNGTGLVGWFEAHYEDGSRVTQYVSRDEQVLDWFMPAPYNPFGPGNKRMKKRNPHRLRQAWNGPNRKFENVGFSLFAWENPHPGKKILALRLVAAETTARWMVLGLSLSDDPVALPESPISHGIPDMWGAAAVVYALIEGIAGVVDTGVAFNRARISPRWMAAGVGQADVTIRLPASKGYVRYTWARTDDGQALSLQIASSADELEVEVLLPDGWKSASALVDGAEAPLALRALECDYYACLGLSGCGPWRVEVRRVAGASGGTSA